MDQAQAHRDMIKGVVDDGYAEINSRKYVFGRTVHKKRRKVFAFFTSVQDEIGVGNFSFIDTPEWDAVEDVIEDIVTLDSLQLSKQPAHWDKHPEDYMIFISTALAAISYPFFGESSGA